MKTVKDFRDAGLVFVSDDIVGGLSGDHCSVPVRMLVPQGSTKPLDAWAIREFAWRANAGEKPSFKGNIDIVTSGESAYTGLSTSFRWDASDSKHSIIKWRPTLIQSRTPEKFNARCGARPISYTRKEELHPDFIAALVKLKKPAFKDGETVFIAQMNPNAGIESKRYYHAEFWCDSGHQRQYVELGLLFNNKQDAESKCRMLVGLPQLPAPIELVDGAAYMFSFEDSEGTGLYVEDEHCLYMVGCQYSVENCTNIRPLTLSK